MAKNEQYKKRLATASLAEAQAMDKAYANAYKNKQKEYTYNGLKYAVTGAPGILAADIVKARTTKTPITSTPTRTTTPTKTTTTPTTSNKVARPNSTVKPDSVFTPKPFITNDTLVSSKPKGTVGRYTIGDKEDLADVLGNKKVANKEYKNSDYRYNDWESTFDKIDSEQRVGTDVTGTPYKRVKGKSYSNVKVSPSGIKYYDEGVKPVSNNNANRRVTPGGIEYYDESPKKTTTKIVAKPVVKPIVKPAVEATIAPNYTNRPTPEGIYNPNSRYPTKKLYVSNTGDANLDAEINSRGYGDDYGTADQISGKGYVSPTGTYTPTQRLSTVHPLYGLNTAINREKTNRRQADADAFNAQMNAPTESPANFNYQGINRQNAYDELGFLKPIAPVIEKMFATGGNLPKYYTGGPFIDPYAAEDAAMAAAGNTGQTAAGATGVDVGRGLDIAKRLGNAGRGIEYGANVAGGALSNAGKSIVVGAGDVNRRLKDPNDTTGTMGMATMGLQAGSQAINMIDGMDGRPSTLGGVASGAMSGASMGAVGGLPGMAAGAVIGGGLALLQAEQAKKEQKKADKRYMSNLTDQNNFTSQQTLRNYASHGITSAGSYAYGGGLPKTPVTNPYLDPRTGAPIGDDVYNNPEEGMNYNQDIMRGIRRDARVDTIDEYDFLGGNGASSNEEFYQQYPTKESFDNRYRNRYSPLGTSGGQLYAYGGDLSQYGKGGKIHIKPENRGKFTAYKKRTGKTTEEALHSKDPHVRKMANFAKNAKKWKHGDGGTLKPYRAKNEEDYKFRQGAYTDSLNAYNTGREVASTIGKNYSTYFKSPEYAKAYLDSYTSGGKKLHPYAEATKYSPKDKVSKYGEEMRAFNATQPKGKESALNAASATALDKLKANKVNPTKILRFTESPSVPIYKKPIQPILPPNVPLETLPIKDYEEYIPQKMPWSTDYDKQTYPDGGLLDKIGQHINRNVTKNIRQTLPINAAMYMQDLTGNLMKQTGDNFLTRGEPTPLTEKDLTPEELAVMRQTQQNAEFDRRRYMTKFPNDNPPKELSYDSYPGDKDFQPDPASVYELIHAVKNPTNRMATTVGGAMYHKNKKGEDVITDRFNFAGKDESDLARENIEKNPRNPYGYLHSLISNYGSTTEDTGIPVNINLGKPKPKAKPVRSGASYFAPKPFNGKKNYAFGGMQEPEYEVEGGEMIQGQPMLEEGQQEQVASDMVKVPDYAPSHAEGGVDGAGGDRVFSDRLKTANKKTYAEEAEQLAKQKAKFEAKIPSTNEAIRNTGERMSERMDMKLDELFNEQEMKKMYAMPSSISSSMAMAYGGHLPKLLYGENLKKPFNYPIGYQYGKAPGASVAPLPKAGGWSYDPRSRRPTNSVNQRGQYNAETRGRAFAPMTGMYLAPGRTSPEGFTNTYLEPTTVDRRTGTQFYVGDDYQDPNALQKLEPRMQAPMQSNYQRPVHGDLKTLPMPTSTGGATAKAMKNGNGIPWQYVDNLASSIMTANTPELAKPYMDPRVDLNTNYDINPQLSSARNTRDALDKSIAASTPQGGASAANRQQLFASYNENANSLYAQKNNIENELKNKEILLNSGINSRNNDKRYAYDEQNVLRRAGIQEDIVGNARNFAQDQYTSARDAKTDARDLENTKQIAMANANAFQYGSQAGLKAIEDIYMANPAQLDSDIATIEKASPNNPALVNMRALQAKLKNR